MIEGINYKDYPILFVDDEKFNLQAFRLSFKRDFTIFTAQVPSEAFEILKREPIAVALIDQVMPVMTGVELLQRIQREYPDIIRVLITGYTDIEAVIAAINKGEVYRYAKKPWSYIELRNLLRTCIDTYYQRMRNKKLVKDLQEMFYGSINALVKAIDARDRYTHNHSQHVMMVTMEIAKQLGFTDGNLEDIYLAALVHDIGKIGVPEDILNKPSRLTKEEFEIIKMHPVIGADILKPVSQFKNIRIYMRHHHEKMDGTGYPDGLRGEEIPYPSRIIAVADVFDALITDRPYRGAMPLDKAIEEIKRISGRHLDPKVTEIFLKLINETSILNEIIGGRK